MGAIELYRDCEKHGQYTTRSISLNEGRSLEDPCPECFEERQAQREAEREREIQERLARQEEQERRERISRRLEALNIPQRFASKTQLESFEENTEGRKQAAAAARRLVLNREVCTLVLSGRVGTGKTHLAIAALCELIRQDFTGHYLTQRQLIREIRATWDKDADESEARVLRRFINVDVLVVDEVGAGFGSEAERAQFFEVIDGRYGNANATILVTNLDRKALAEYIGERAFDRLREQGLWVPFNWKSMRGDTHPPAQRREPEPEEPRRTVVL